jgi:general L-amino acid transport system substrate-binding protein
MIKTVFAAFIAALGAGSAMKIERGLNALWNNGGLMYAIPLR